MMIAEFIACRKKAANTILIYTNQKSIVGHTFIVK